jgi:UDP-N-acetyl-D-mannosaminuronic acid dehydrogenase
LGLAFKANIDDVRESPAVDIVKRISREYPAATILVVAPHADRLPDELGPFANVQLAGLDDAVAAAQVVVLLVDHDKFREVDPRDLASKRVVDTRGFWH